MLDELFLHHWTKPDRDPNSFIIFI
jgi:hypothetical protein